MRTTSGIWLVRAVLDALCPTCDVLSQWYNRDQARYLMLIHAKGLPDVLSWCNQLLSDHRRRFQAQPGRDGVSFGPL